MPWLGVEMRADSREGQGSFSSFMTYITKITFFQHSSTTWAITHRGFTDRTALDWCISNWTEQILHERLQKDMKDFQLKAVFHPLFSKPPVSNRVRDAGAYPSILGHRQGITLDASNSQSFMSLDDGKNQNTQKKPIPTLGEHAKLAENSLLTRLPWCPTELRLFLLRSKALLSEEPHIHWLRMKRGYQTKQLSLDLKYVSGTTSFVVLETTFVSNKYIPYIYQTPIQTFKKKGLKPEGNDCL